MIRKQVDLQLPCWCRLLSGDIEPRQGIITRAPACPWGRGALLLHHPPPLQYLSIHTLPPSILCQAVLLQHVQLYFHTLTLPRPPHFHVAFSTSISEPRYHNPHIILPANVYNVQRKALKKYEKRLWSSTRRREESGRWFWSQAEHFACVSFISILREANPMLK